MSDPATANRIPGALPPPPGVTPNFVNPFGHVANAIAVHTILLTFTTLFVGMRVGLRAFALHQFGFDDACILGAWALNAACSGCILKTMTIGMGRHLWNVPKTSIIPLGEWLYISSIMTRPTWLLIKLAFLWSYKRIFAPSVAMKWCCYVGSVICAGLYISQIFHDIFVCIPVQKDWNTKLSGHCLPSGVGGSVTGIFNVISDAYILILPLPFLWMLQMRLASKLRLMALFCVGAFVNAASITRLVLTYTLASSKDVSWKTYTLVLWITIEINLGLICVCALVLPAFWDKFLSPRLSQYTTYYGSGSGSRTRTTGTRISDGGESEHEAKFDPAAARDDPEHNAILLRNQQSAATLAGSGTTVDDSAEQIHYAPMDAEAMNYQAPAEWQTVTPKA